MGASFVLQSQSKEDPFGLMGAEAVPLLPATTASGWEGRRARVGASIVRPSPTSTEGDSIFEGEGRVLRMSLSPSAWRNTHHVSIFVGNPSGDASRIVNVTLYGTVSHSLDTAGLKGGP